MLHSNSQSGFNSLMPKRIAAIRKSRHCLSKMNFKGAASALQPIAQGIRKDAEALYLMGLIREGLKDFGGAHKYAQQSLKLRETSDGLWLLARMERILGNTDKCILICDSLLAKRPDFVPAQTIKAGALEAAGRFREATTVLEPLISIYSSEGKPIPPEIQAEWVRVQVQNKEYSSAIAGINDLLAYDTLAKGAERSLLHLRAKACDRNGDYGEAWTSAARANELMKVEFDSEFYAEQVNALIDNWSRDNMARFPRANSHSEVPVFIAGMPRSGTSLIDQIIDAHPMAAGVGELASIEKFAQTLSAVYDPTKEPPECFGKMGDQKWTNCARNYLREVRNNAPDAKRIVNKALGNNKLVGLIARLYPKTRIIHAIRDPRDVAISCYMGGFNNNMHAYTTQVDWTAYTWAQSVRMMRHWASALDVPVLDVCYERLVSDPESEFPRIIEFLGLEWDNNCRQFHESKRIVRTLSYDQVNRPIYTSSKGRYTNYANFIEKTNFPPYDPDAGDPTEGVADWLNAKPHYSPAAESE